MDFPAFDIDPVETLFLCAPARRFAEQGAGVEEELDHIRGLAPAVAAAQHCNAIRRPRLIPRHPGSSRRLSLSHPSSRHSERREAIHSTFNQHWIASLTSP